MMDNKTLKANAALVTAAFFWGTAFVFQRQAMENLTPLAYGGLRFFIGGMALLPLALPRALKILKTNKAASQDIIKIWLKGGIAAGGFIFFGASFQQYGLIYTTAGKAGFISSLYVVLIPLILRLRGHKISFGEGFGATLALIGLYLLSFTGTFNLAPGDGLVLIGAFIWSGHVLTVAWFAPKMDSIILGAGQALVCGILSLAATVVLGQWPSLGSVSASWLDILWGSLFSVTLGFTLQVVGQKEAKPVPAAIIMQMEAVIAAIAGWLFAGEIMSPRMLIGAAVMLAGILTSQLWPFLMELRRIKSDN